MTKSLDLLKGFFCCLILVAGFTACEEDDPIVDNPYVPGSEGVFILNEGSWGGNNASLTYYNFNTTTTTADIFGGKLGDTAQDMIAYGGKLYITVTESNCIKVVNLNTMDTLKTITNISNPRYLAASGGKVYATAYGTTTGEVLKIDTTSFAVAKTTVGAYPEGIAALNNKLYVANGGYGAGNTVSVVNLTSFQEESTIPVPQNPFIIKADKDGLLYLTSQDVYNSVTWDFESAGGLHIINPQTKAVTENILPATQRFDILDDLLYFYTYEGCSVYNIKTKTTAPIISDGTVIANPYAIAINPKTKEVYVSDGNYTSNGDVYVFGTDGKKKNTIHAGISANAFVFN